MIKILGINICIALVCGISTFSALEEVIINIIAKTLNLNIKGIYMISRRRFYEK